MKDVSMIHSFDEATAALSELLCFIKQLAEKSDFNNPAHIKRLQTYIAYAHAYYSKAEWTIIQEEPMQ